MLNITEISPGNISLEEYRWSRINDSKFEREKNYNIKQLEEIIEDMIYKNLS